MALTKLPCPELSHFPPSHPSPFPHFPISPSLSIVLGVEDLKHPLVVSVAGKASGVIKEESQVGSIRVNLAAIHDFYDKKFHQLDKKGHVLFCPVSLPCQPLNTPETL